MTYRLVPPHMWARLQKALLGVTIFIGTGIVLAPNDVDARLTAIEKFMNADIWGYAMLSAAAMALAMELWMDRRKSVRFINAVGYMHIICASLLLGFAGSTASALLTRTWWNVGAPALAMFLVYMHSIYIRRRPRNFDAIIDGVLDANR